MVASARPSGVARRAAVGLDSAPVVAFLDRGDAVHSAADHRSLRMPDTLILAAAEVHRDVDLLLTGDAAMAGVRGLECRVSLLEPAAQDCVAIALGAFGPP